MSCSYYYVVKADRHSDCHHIRVTKSADIRSRIIVIALIDFVNEVLSLQIDRHLTLAKTSIFSKAQSLKPNAYSSYPLYPKS
jgi:predicted nucleic acid-binding Zn finger protein